VNLRVVAGNGDDSIVLKQITGETQVFGGAGADTLTLSNPDILKAIDGRLIYDGDAHIDERTSVLTELPIPGPFPKVFVDTEPTDSSPFFVDAFGQKILANAVLKTSSSKRLAGLGPSRGAGAGELVRDFVREQAVPDFGVQQQGKQRLGRALPEFSNRSSITQAWKNGRRALCEQPIRTSTRGTTCP
jgi:hypothetical protein